MSEQGWLSNTNIENMDELGAMFLGKGCIKKLQNGV